MQVKIQVTKGSYCWTIDAVALGLSDDPASNEWVEKCRIRLGEVYREGDRFVAFDMAGNASRAKSLELAVSKRLAGITSFVR